MMFVDMRNFVQFLPEDKKNEVTADYDSIKATVQGFNVGIRITGRTPYSSIEFKDDGAPFSFGITMHFDAAGGDPDKTDFHIEMTADLNFMMKMMLGSKLQEMLDKIAQGRLNKFYQEVCLLEQAFVKEPKENIQQYLHSHNKDLTVVAFKRVTLNEE